jgi:peptidyl-prolyl cis-trans isomerase C
MLRRDPLVHFLLIGGLLFAVLSWFGAPPPADPELEPITITADQVAEIERSAALLQGREPTRAELERLVRDAIRDEVYYRRAIELGLDANDDVVRQRLIEKMRYVTENTADPEPPEADLKAYFASHADRFRIPELVSFDQVFFSPRERGESARSDAEEALEALRDGADPARFGDRTPLDSRFEAADPDRVRVLFGEELTQAVFSAAVGEWLGPIESDFGWHVVRVIERSQARDPEFAEVEDAVRRTYADDRLAAANAAAFDAMRRHFDIAVQWQADSEPEPWP